MSKNRNVNEEQAIADRLPLADDNDEVATSHIEGEPADRTSHSSDDAAMSQRLRDSEASRRRLLSVLEDEKRLQSALRQSESRLRAIVDSALDGIITIDHEGIVVDLNAAAEQMFGLTPGAAVGRLFAEVAIPPRLREAHRQGLARCVATGETKLVGRRVETMGCRTNGTEFPVELTVARIAGDGPPIFTGHLRDITERKTAEEQLRIKDLAIQSAVTGICFSDLEGRVTDCNLAFLRMWGAERVDQLRGKSVTEFGSDPEVVEQILIAIRTSGSWEGEDVARRLDGSSMHVQLATVLIRGDQGPVGMMATFRDITAQKETEQALKESEARYRAIVEDQTEFIVRWKPDGVRTFVNDAYCRCFGQPRERLLGTSFFPLISDEDLSRVKARIDKLTPLAPVSTDHHRVLLQDGTMAWQEWTDRALYDERGALVGYQSVGRDITKQKEAEQALCDSEEKFRTLAEKSPNMIFINQGGSVVFANEACEKIMGYSRDELYAPQFDFRILIAPQSLPAVNEHFRRHQQGDEVPAQEYQLLTKDGRRIDVIQATRLIHYGDRPALLGIITDVTERRQAERELRLRHEVIASSVTPTAFGDDQFRITYANQAFLDLFGFDSEEQVLGMPNTRFDAKPTSLAEINAAMKERGSWVGEVTTRKLDGTPVDAMLRASLLRDESGGPIYSLVTFWDITDRKQAERSLRRSEDKLRELNAELEQRVVKRTAELRDKNAELQAFAHTVSHDLRTPLRAIEGFAGALAEDYGERLDEDAHEFIRHIVNSAQRMDQLVQDLLTHSRLGRAELKLSDVPLDTVVRSALEQLERQVADSGTVIRTDKNLPRVKAHHVTLTQILANLISNGMKFVAPDVTPDVKIWAEACDAGMVRLWVEDNGIGIGDANHARIFHVFERLHGIESYPGTGIGLAIVARGCERLGGRCGVESQPGRGSRFWIEFPAGDAEELEF